jgi:hypothetical protein
MDGFQPTVEVTSLNVGLRPGGANVMPLIDPPNDEVGDIQHVIVLILSVKYVI